MFKCSATVTQALYCIWAHFQYLRMRCQWMIVKQKPTSFFVFSWRHLTDWLLFLCDDLMTPDWSICSVNQLLIFTGRRWMETHTESCFLLLNPLATCSSGVVVFSVISVIWQEERTKKEKMYAYVLDWLQGIRPCDDISTHYSIQGLCKTHFPWQTEDEQAVNSESSINLKISCRQQPMSRKSVNKGALLIILNLKAIDHRDAVS